MTELVKLREEIDHCFKELNQLERESTTSGEIIDDLRRVNDIELYNDRISELFTKIEEYPFKYKFVVIHKSSVTGKNTVNLNFELDVDNSIVDIYCWNYKENPALQDLVLKEFSNKKYSEIDFDQYFELVEAELCD